MSNTHSDKSKVVLITGCSTGGHGDNVSPTGQVNTSVRDDAERSPCCSPSVGEREGGAAGALAGVDVSTVDSTVELVELPGGRFTMGTDGDYGYAADGEGPAHEVCLAPFAISRLAITNAQFAQFVEATGHKTEAEVFGWSFVFAGLLPDDHPPTQAIADAPWWHRIDGADWSHPEGPGSGIAERKDHPVVHVSWHDAVTFCTWHGSRLPSEAEWEYAARAGSDGRFPWGDEIEPGGETRMNVFCGEFPECAAGESPGTVAADAFAANAFGLHNVTGNVWEWCGDWFDGSYYARSPVEDPSGPTAGDTRVLRGGSYLCHESYCNRYRVDARSNNTPDSSSGNTGFRVARSIA
ncbi:MAG: formylglycine-generating enzyme family protein [Solirubrobacterales bacterium]